MQPSGDLPVAPGEQKRYAVDIHCHVFNALDLPVEGFLRSLARGHGLPEFLSRGPARQLERAIVKLARLRAGRGDPFEEDEACWAIEHATMAFEPMRVEFNASGAAGQLGALIRTIELMTRRREDVARQIATDFPQVKLFTPALVDFEHWHPGSAPATSFEEQVELHERVSLRFAKSGTGPYFHHYVPYNPLRDVKTEGQSLSLVQNAITERGFIGVKLYPPTGFLPINNARLNGKQDRRYGAELDERLRAFYDWCEGESVPILAHAADSYAFQPGFGWRSTPWGWSAVLQEYPKLRLCLGHFGGLRGVEEDMELSCSCWPRQIVELMAEHDQVYADISHADIYRDASVAETYEKMLKRRFEEFSEAGERIMYGSDWWMLSFNPEAQGEFFPETHRFYSAHFNSALNGFIRHNALSFLGIQDKSGAIDDCNKNRKRLVHYYRAQGLALPDWLGTEPSWTCAVL